MLIMPEDLTFKINENDGAAGHMQTQVDMIKYLNGEEISALDGKGNLMAFTKKHGEIHQKGGFEVRIVSTPDTLTFAAIGPREGRLTDFQISSLERILKELRSIDEKNLYEAIEGGLTLPNGYTYDFDSLSEEVLKDLLDVLEKERYR